MPSRPDQPSPAAGFFGCLLLLSFVASLAVASLPEPRDSERGLLGTLARLRPSLAESAFGFPLRVESSDRGDRLAAEAYGVFPHALRSVADALEAPSNWCEIADLHPNVKIATYEVGSEGWLLSCDCGSKASSEAPYRLAFRLKERARTDGYFALTLAAERGPLGTTEHVLRVEAVPAGPGSTFLHVSYSYAYGRALRLAERVYFGTLGRDKVGFTVTGTDPTGAPVYISGPRAAVERNAARYYFAVEAFLESLGQPEPGRLAGRLNAWFERTSRLKQLCEPSREEYVGRKLADHARQEALQRGIATAAR